MELSKNQAPLAGVIELRYIIVALIGGFRIFKRMNVLNPDQ